MISSLKPTALSRNHNSKVSGDKGVLDFISFGFFLVKQSEPLFSAALVLELQRWSPAAPLSKILIGMNKRQQKSEYN